MATEHIAPEPFEGLLRRYQIDQLPSPGQLVTASLAIALRSGTDPGGIIAYLAELGITVRTMDDLLAINEMADEEELSAHRVAEGVAITVASQGDWYLFKP